MPVTLTWSKVTCLQLPVTLTRPQVTPSPVCSCRYTGLSICTSMVKERASNLSSVRFLNREPSSWSSSLPSTCSLYRPGPLLAGTWGGQGGQVRSAICTSPDRRCWWAPGERVQVRSGQVRSVQQPVLTRPAVAGHLEMEVMSQLTCQVSGLCRTGTRG